MVGFQSTSYVITVCICFWGSLQVGDLRTRRNESTLDYALGVFLVLILWA